MNSSQWYIAVAGQTSGPIETEMVLQGLKQGSVPPSAHVCPVGAAEWLLIAEVSPFSDSLATDEADQRGEPAAEGESVDDMPDEGVISQAGADASESDGTDSSDSTTIDWTEPLLGYLVHWDDVTLPEEKMLLDDLAHATPELLIQQQAMWNLALCVAVGSESLATRASKVIFDTLAHFRRPDRLAWLLRALRGKGFVPSGVPEDAAERAVRRLLQDCPPELLAAASQGKSSLH